MADPAARRLWQHCRRIADAVALPDPFDAAVFVAGLGAARGRPVELLPLRGRHDLPCGLLVTTERADYIAYSADTAPLHRQHILLHEAAHLLCGHRAAGGADLAAASTLLPHLDPTLVRRVLGRTVYTDPQEREAELVASLILTRVTRRARRRGQTPTGDLRSIFEPGSPPETPGAPA